MAKSTTTMANTAFTSVEVGTLAEATARLGAMMACLGLAACAGPSGSPNTAQSASCDDGFLCGSYLDKDTDGGITPAEWSEGFRAADTNGDGQLSQGEFQAGGGNWGGGGGRGGR